MYFWLHEATGKKMGRCRRKVHLPKITTGCQLTAVRIKLEKIFSDKYSVYTSGKL